MGWLDFAEFLIRRVPFEKFLVPPRDNTKEVKKLAGMMTISESERKELVQESPVSTVTESKYQAELPTAAETTEALKRRLAKELYRAELDLTGELLIAGKPCDCLDEKHTLGLEATAEELIPQEPGNPTYREIIQWIKANRYKVSIPAILSGNYREEYPRMAAEFKGFRKRILGTTALTAMIEPKEPLTLEKAKQMAAEQAAEEVEKKWLSREKK